MQTRNSSSEKINSHASVISAIPLNKEEREDIANILQNKLKSKIELKNIVDKSVIAGLYIRVGDQVADLTIRSKIENLKERLLS